MQQVIFRSEGIMYNSAVNRVLMLTPCTKNKCTDYVPEKGNVVPGDYLGNDNIIHKLEAARASSFKLAGNNYDSTSKQVYAFDLYVRHPRTQLYKNLRDSGLAERARKAMLETTFPAEWFFLSGGYGLVHALELTRSYQATFSQQMATQAGIPFTGNIWKNLPGILDEIFQRLSPSMIHFFGATDYLNFVTATNTYKQRPGSFRLLCGRATNLDLREALISLVKGLLPE
jgi:hypothetical protein